MPLPEQWIDRRPAPAEVTERVGFTSQQIAALRQAWDAVDFAARMRDAEVSGGAEWKRWRLIRWEHWKVAVRLQNHRDELAAFEDRQRRKS